MLSSRVQQHLRHLRKHLGDLFHFLGNLSVRLFGDCDCYEEDNNEE